MVQKILIILFLLLFLGSCDEAKTDTGDLPKDNVVFISTSDYSTGSYSLLDLENLKTHNNLGTGFIHSDTSLRIFNKLIYIINREGRDNIQIIDPKQKYKTITEYSTGSSSNPHDLVIDTQGIAYISRYDSSSLLIANLNNGEKIGYIDLSAYGVRSGNLPSMSSLYLYDNYLFIALQRLTDQFRPSDYSSIIVVDTITNSIVKEIKLQWQNSSLKTIKATNPYTAFKLVSSKIWQPDTADGHAHLFISCTGEFGYYYQEDGGVVAIDLIDLELEAGFVVSEEQLQEEIVDFEVSTKGDIYLLSSNISFQSKLIRYNLQSKSIVAELLTADDNLGSLTSLSLHSSGKLFVCSRNILYPGIIIIDTINNDRIISGTYPLNTGLPPVKCAFIE